MPYVFSTLSCDVHYHVFDVKKAKRGEEITQPSRVLHTVTIKGGAGIANKRLDTPLGVVTEISNDDLAVLESDSTFKTHRLNGFITVRKDKVDAEVAVADMDSRDHSAPFTPEDNLNGDVNATDKPNTSKSTKKDKIFKVTNNIE